MFFGKDNIERIKQRRHGIGGGYNPYRHLDKFIQEDNFKKDKEDKEDKDGICS